MMQFRGVGDGVGDVVLRSVVQSATIGVVAGGRLKGMPHAASSWLRELLR